VLVEFEFSFNLPSTNPLAFQCASFLRCSVAQKRN
jgi:hypothetical protein